MPINTNYWYHDSDMDVALRAFILNNPDILSRQEDWIYRLQLEAGTLVQKKVLLSLTPPASNQEPFFFLNKALLPEDSKLNEQIDVFDELLMAWDLANSKVSILFALNMGGAHWTSARIDITKSQTGQDKTFTYTALVSHFDPFGSDGTMPSGSLDSIKMALVSRLMGLGDTKTVVVNTGKANDPRRQAFGDGTSCGPITVRDLSLLLQAKTNLAVQRDEASSADGVFALGTEELRQQQLDGVTQANTSFPKILPDSTKKLFDERLTSDKPPVPPSNTTSKNGQGLIYQDQSGNYDVAVSVATLAAGLQNQTLKNAIVSAIQDGKLYSTSLPDYLGRIYEAVSVIPTNLLSLEAKSADEKAFQASLILDIPYVSAIEDLLFGPGQRLPEDTLTATLFQAASFIDFCNNYSIKTDLNTTEARQQLNFILQRILLNVEDLRSRQLELASQENITFERSLEVSSFGKYEMNNQNYLRLYHDASEDRQGTAGAFHDIGWAIDQAEQLVFMVDWSFHPQTYLSRNNPDDLTQQVGDKLVRRAGQGVLVAINTWKHPKFGAPDPANNNAGTWFAQRIADMALAAPDNWTKENATENLLWRASLYGEQNFSETLGPADWTHSHHQKFVVVDVPDGNSGRTLAVFYGGLDITKGRYDWPDHPLAPGGVDSVERATFVGRYDDYYNGEFADNATLVREPWHDIHAQLIGPVAFDFLLEFTGRWNHSQNNLASYSDLGSIDKSAIQKVYNKARDTYNSLRENSYKAASDISLVGTDEAFNVQLVRSLFKGNWKQNPPDPDDFTKNLKWKNPNKVYEASILQAYLETIRKAERFIYIETQYLIGSGKYWNSKQPAIVNELPTALVEKIIEKHSEKQEFHVYVVLPMFPEGSPPTIPMQGIRYLQWETVKYMLRALAAAGVPWENYLSFYCLGRSYGVDRVVESKIRKNNVKDNLRYMIYVHSKFMLVDDRYAIVGSANLNDRSLAGNGDTEIATLISAQRKTLTSNGSSAMLQAFRMQLWAEHLGTDVSKDKYTFPQQQQTWTTLIAQGEANLQNFLAGKACNHLLKFPIALTKKGFFEKASYFSINQMKNEIRFNDQFNDMRFIPDAPKSTGTFVIREITDDWRTKPSTVFSATNLTVNIAK